MQPSPVASPLSEIVTVSRFEALPADFRDLLAQPGLSFDQTAPWLEAFGRHVLPPDSELLLLCIRDGAGPLVLLPLYRGPAAAFGSRLHSLSNFYTAHFAPIARKGASPDRVADAIVDAVVDIRQRWHQLDLTPLDVESGVFGAISDALHRAGVFVEPYFRFGNWYADVRGMDSETYFTHLPSQLRNTIVRKRRLFERTPGNDVRIVSRPEALTAAMEEYEQVYAASWKPREPHPEFLRSIIECFGELGWARLGIARADGIPVAAQIWFVREGTASIFKLAYRSAYAHLSPGSLLTMHMIRHALDEDGVEHIDYLTGDDAYKRHWMSHRRERWGIRAYNPRMLMGLAGASRAVIGRTLNRLRAPFSAGGQGRP
jgi:CelD/BcsL family acetyltransferase involved in cellulose biosynthesis